MKFRPWLAGAAGAAAVTLGFGATASAAVHHTTSVWPAHVSIDARPLPLTVRPGATPSKTYYGSWAGYVALANNNVALRYVAADFNAPSINCTGAIANASVEQFIGLEGWNAPGERIGIQAACSSTGTYTWQGWYTIGKTGGSVSTATINPGDAIQASVYYDASTNQFTFYLNDLTQGGTPIFNTPESCPTGQTCSTASAEAITAVPYNNGTKSYLPLANYGMENFTGGAVTSRSGLKGTFASSTLWNTVETIIRPGSTILATSSSLQGGSGFSTTWHAQS
jgi:hypothetical protein